QQRTAKRGGDQEVLALDGLDISLPVSRWEELYSLEQGLLELEARQPRQARVVECRFFGGS
ncbi:MAG: ECF-type sigma factor, partial [Pseudomonadota bacterium]